MKKIKNYFFEIWNVLRLPEMLILPGNLAFYLILSLIPIISLIGIITSNLNLSTSVITNYFNASLPSQVAEIFIDLFTRSDLGTTSTIFFILGFYVASNGPGSLITASNVLYKTFPHSSIFSSFAKVQGALSVTYLLTESANETIAIAASAIS